MPWHLIKVEQAITNMYKTELVFLISYNKVFTN